MEGEREKVRVKKQKINPYTSNTMAIQKKTKELEIYLA
jgi:hypothetical protein